MKKLFLLDGHALIYRAHFAFISRPLINSKGINTSAASGFTRSLWELIRNQKPTHLAVSFDVSGPTFRHEMYTPYKANRDAQPEDITLGLTQVKEIINGFNIPIVTLQGYEADDVIGTLAKQAEKEGFQVYMVTPDKDYAQLVSENIFMYKPGRKGGDPEILGVKEICEQWGIENVHQVIDVLGLQGDSSDNIPGVPGVGPKTAVKLLAEFGSIENVLKNTNRLKGKLRERVEENANLALLSKELATINIDSPVQFDADSYAIKDFDREKLSEIFSELEFRTLAKSILSGTDNNKALFEKFESESSKASRPEKEYSVVNKALEDVEHEYIRLMPDDLVNFVKEFSKSDLFCFDTETTGLNSTNTELVGIAFSNEAHKAYYLNVPEDAAEAIELLKPLLPLFENEDIAKVGQNIKFDMNVLRQYGVEVKGKLYDTMIMHYLLEPDLRHGLSFLSESYLKYKMVPIEDLIGKKGVKQGSMRDVPVDDVVRYAGEDADITLQLLAFLMPKLVEEELLELYETIEMPLISVLSRMEAEGIRLDGEFLHKYSDVLGGKIAEKKKEIYEKAGTEFNIASPKQVGEVLFDKLKIPYRWRKTAGSGQYSTSEQKLSELSHHHEVVAEILEFRKLSKLKSTYVDALPQMINPKTGMVHTSYNQARAATGRLSSESPNLQNIPIRDKAGREIRNAFIPRDEGHVLLAADYSQVELRLISAISGDEALIDAFQKDQDIHRATASRVFQVPYDEVTSDQRRSAKTVNFSIIYGAGATNLSQQLSIKRAEAKELISTYFMQYPGLKTYMDQVVAEARRTGIVKTLMGRKRILRDINSRNGLLRSTAERISINTPVQGTAADLIKIAMINIQDEFDKRNLATKMILQVHDELVFDVKKEELEEVKEIVKEKMEGAMKDISVPLKVDMDTGNTWLEAH